MHKFKSHLRSPNAKQWISLLLALAVSVVTVNYRYEAKMLLTSVTGMEEHDAFDGTVMPIQEAPNWTALSSAEYEMSYQELPSSKLETILPYRTDYLTFNSADLVWGESEHDKIRNTKITYPVSYAGNYELDDCGEGCGSHPAVDIKVPEGTPVYSVANGIVTKAGTSSGFGKTIVVKHNDVPDPSVSGTSTLYSSYSHLSEYFVVEGQEVHKGEVIGHVGNSGTATTYHLHFQLDSADAPWHPYWPFTSSEASAAGYGFWEAVNHGVGSDNMYKYTRNPMNWVQDNLDSDAVVGNDSAITVTVREDDEEDGEGDTTAEDSDEDSNANLSGSDDAADEGLISTVINIGFTDIEIETPAFIMPAQNRPITLKMLDSNGDTDDDATFDGRMNIKVNDESLAKLNKSYVENVDFNGGETELSLYADHEGMVIVTAEIAGRSYYSSPVYIVATIEPFAKFGIVHDGTFVPGKSETIQIQARDLNGNPTPGFYGDGTIELSIVKGSGTFSKDELTKKDLPNGIAEVSFTGDNEESVIIQVTYGKKVEESSALEAELFNDMDSADDYYTAVSYLYGKGTVQGYPDGTFKPANTVSRIEALKFIFSGLDREVETGLTSRFNDTSNDQWYSHYLATASSLGVVQGYSDGSFKPNQGVNRVEFLKMMFSTVDISVDPVVTEDPYEDVNNLSWYAPYVQYAKEKNIFPTSGDYFNPGDPMSRLEVAEVIYRMIAVEQNGGDSYSVLMEAE